ncbi:MAG: amidohydrolase [Bacteroidetes bacterium CG02_land_8_20_14_3_00_31_25]|nr:MAG: amidohydrolase [Bacteroidetes bacterium CG02_land_8_20_14_3_00_31_25]PIY03474.1 MAG: amidohydrolase [Bacteroidetes bacterium CG_4_10_14_3_um_filter_31_20]
MSILKISLIQSNLAWENPDKNLQMFEKKITEIKRESDIVLLPEMFTTGFSMNPKPLAETMDGKTVLWIKKQANENNFALGGSVIIKDNNNFYNRFIFVEPNGLIRYYDKHHLFSITGENNEYTAGNARTIIKYKGFKFLLQICYDLRFPVWMRNKNDYDAILLVANWPERRKEAWKQLLIARAMENQCYIAAVNRVGNDGNNISHTGDSMILDYAGRILISAKPFREEIINYEFNLNNLNDAKEKFPSWKDSDEFEIK